MVGVDGFPSYFNNALDYYRKILYHNRSEAERVRAEFLGNPLEISDQTRAGPYRDHVLETFRTRPHSLTQNFEEVKGDPPAHLLLAAYSGNMCTQLASVQPERDICVIATQKNNRGQVIVSVWQKKTSFFYSEGMIFDLLDCMDGNIPAVMIGGTLRTDGLGRYPNASEDIQQLWSQAEICFLQKNCVGVPDPTTFLRQCLIEGGNYLQERWQRQCHQQLEYRQWISQQQFQQPQQIPVQQQAPAMLLPSQQPGVSLQQKTKAAGSSKRRSMGGKTGAGVQKRRKTKKVESPRERSPSSPDSLRSGDGGIGGSTHGT